MFISTKTSVIPPAAAAAILPYHCFYTILFYYYKTSAKQNFYIMYDTQALYKQYSLKYNKDITITSAVFIYKLQYYQVAPHLNTDISKTTAGCCKAASK